MRKDGKDLLEHHLDALIEFWKRGQDIKACMMLSPEGINDNVMAAFLSRANFGRFWEERKRVNGWTDRSPYEM